MHRIALALVFVTALGLSGRAAQAPYAPTLRTFSGSIVTSHYVTMRDGVRLAVDVHLPKGLEKGERTATILHMSGYYRSVDMRTVWKPFIGFAPYPITERDIRDDFVKAGYSWIDADIRGSGASFGHRDYPLTEEEVRDGADLIDWIVAQPWSAGIVGATGSSYDGMLALMLTRNRHPALKAVAPRFSGWDGYNDDFMPGGVKARAFIEEWDHLATAFDSGHFTNVFGWEGAALASGVHPVSARELPAAFADHKRNFDITRLMSLVEYRDSTDGVHIFDDFSPYGVREADAVPIYQYGGWFDGALQRGQIRSYLENRNPGSRLRIGPWFHGGESNASQYADGGKSDFDHAKDLLRFFDYHLRGVDRGFTSQEPIHYYTMGEGWKSSRVWPPAGGEARTLYFAPNGQLAADSPTTGAAHDEYRVDPLAASDPGSRWGMVVGTGRRHGYGDQRDLDRRMVTYTSPPLRQDVEITGDPVVHLFMSANATDGAVFAYLQDVRPSGEATYVTEGDLRLLDRKLATSPLRNDPVVFHSFLKRDAEPMTPGEVTDVVFDLLPTSVLIRAGDSIRLAIAGADKAVFDAPLTPGLTYDLYRDRGHQSRLELTAYRH